MTLREKVIMRQCAQANNKILAGDDAALNTTKTENNPDIKREAEERILPQMAKVHDVLEIWQGSQNLHATQKESDAQNMQMTAVRYMLDT